MEFYLYNKNNHLVIMFAVPIELPEVPVPELIQEVNIHDPVNDDDLAEAQL